ncbi:MAG: hypothetical protein IPF92_13905 [Myxococcales bacterium]|nr:hypothetical protein [Myxococcales bacterium]MBL0194969.1 hypothetical protein [Myxococcales bacterium]HQY61066.1 hypothetical protein [Polyangiaceae bacterium]
MPPETPAVVASPPGSPVGLTRLRAVLDVVTRFDLALALCGIAFGAQSLLYPFGRDQATHGYIGREWLAGRLPFVSTFDIKTPGIFFAHMTAFFLFGDHMWGIRVLDLFGCVLPVGVLAAYAVTPRGERPRPGLIGFGVLAANLLTFGPFDFWNTAQCESFCSVFALAAMTSSVRGSSRAALASGVRVGLFATLAVLFKPPTAFSALAAYGVLLWALARQQDDRRATLRSALLATAGCAVGAALPLALMFGYFGAKGALPAMHEVLVVIARQYVVGGSYVNGVLQGLQSTTWGITNFNATFIVVANALPVLAYRARARGDRHTVLLCGAAAAGLVAGVLTVVIQLKFFTYHWVAMVGLLVFAVTALARELDDRLRASGGVVAMKGPLAVLVLLQLVGAAQGARGLQVAKRALYLARTGDRAPLDQMWTLPNFYAWTDSRAVGMWVRDHAAPDDRLAVRGFEPQIYFAANKRYDGRFFWSTFLTEKRFSAGRDRLSQEDFASFKAAPPRWVVALTYEHTGVNAAETYERLGYVRREETDSFTVLERPAAPTFRDQTSW